MNFSVCKYIFEEEENLLYTKTTANSNNWSWQKGHKQYPVIK